jgi:hypothetical protein
MGGEMPVQFNEPWIESCHRFRREIARGSGHPLAGVL